MNKTQIIIGGVRAAEFSINLKSGAGILNDIMIISVNPIENYQPDHTIFSPCRVKSVILYLSIKSLLRISYLDI